LDTRPQLLEFISLHAFDRMAEGLIDDDDLRLLQQELITDPRAGDVVQRTGGLRKLRVAVEGRGKRGGARLLYLYVQVRSVIYLVAVYSKIQEPDLSRADYQRMAELVKHLKRETR
jgi:hypothetical protein